MLLRFAPLACPVPLVGLPMLVRWAKKVKHFPYSVSERRPLSADELALLRGLVAAEAPERMPEVEELHVIARCGCGKCPTVMFRENGAREAEASAIVADYMGGSEGGGLVGIILWETDGRLSELEAWSIDGQDIVEWPPLESVVPVDAARDHTNQPNKTQ